MYRSRVSALLIVALTFASCASGGGGDSGGSTDAAATIDPAKADLSGRSGTPLKQFKLPRVNGKPFDVKKHVGNDVLMISFWATWCAPCKAELGRMAPVYDRLADQGFVYVAVSTDAPTDVPKVKPYVDSYGYQFPVLLDTQSELMARYNPRGDMPFYILVNRKGEVVEQHQGFSPGDEVLIEAKIKSLLGAAQ